MDVEFVGVVDVALPAWNEGTMAYAARLPVYAIIKEGINPGGLLPRITTKERFTRMANRDK